MNKEKPAENLSKEIIKDGRYVRVFDRQAAKIGWKWVNEYGFGDGKERFNPDGEMIYDGHTVYQNDKGEYADAYYVDKKIKEMGLNPSKE